MTRSRARGLARGLAPLLLWLPLAALADDDPAGLLAHDAWVRLPPPGTNAAAYLRLENPTGRTLAVVGAHSPDCERVEIHRSVVADGVARMEPVDRLELAPGERVVLAPRGLHLMLIGPRALSEGERVGIVLELADGGTRPVEAEVRRRAASGGHEHH